MTITLAQWLNAGVNVVLPIIVAIVSARLASGALKAVVLLVLSALAGYLISWLAAVNDALPFDFSQASFTAVLGFVVAVATHFGVWKPAAVTGSKGLIQNLLPGGLGGPPAGDPRHSAE